MGSRNDFISFDLSGAQDILKMKVFTDPNLYNKALRGGMTYAAKAVPPAVAKQIGSRYNLTAARIKAGIGSPRFRDQGQSATVPFSSKPLTVQSYGGRQAAHAYSFAIFRGQRMTWQRAFLQTRGKLAGRPLFRVKAGPETKEAGGRSKVDIIHGPSIGSIFGGASKYGPEIKAAVEKRISEQFATGLERVLAAAKRGH